jgi:hypothetical protein
VTVRDEINFVKQYLELEKQVWRDRLEIDVESNILDEAIVNDYSAFSRKRNQTRAVSIDWRRKDQSWNKKECRYAIFYLQTLALALQIKQRFWYRYRIDKYEVNSKNVQLYLKDYR